jgi:hypothetical protein
VAYRGFDRSADRPSQMQPVFRSNHRRCKAPRHRRRSVSPRTQRRGASRPEAAQDRRTPRDPGRRYAGCGALGASDLEELMSDAYGRTAEHTQTETESDASRFRKSTMAPRSSARTLRQALGKPSPRARTTTGSEPGAATQSPTTSLSPPRRRHRDPLSRRGVRIIPLRTLEQDRLTPVRGIDVLPVLIFSWPSHDYAAASPAREAVRVLPVGRAEKT